MTDIVERLREEGLGFGIGPAGLCQEAAEEIKRLRHRIVELEGKNDQLWAELNASQEALGEELVARRKDAESLRDWFAGQALAGMMADSQINCSAALAARYCYEMADAMLKARGGE